MVTPQRQAASTRDRLLFSACRIFASKGYRDTTVADICDAAQANIASVNYHFGNKESLYRQVFQRLIDLYEPPQKGNADNSEALLRFYVLDRLEWLVQDDPLERLIRAEMVQPTGLVDDLRVAGLEKTQSHFVDAVRSVGGNVLSDTTLRLCVTSILSQCRAFMAVNKAGVYTANMPRPTDAELAAYADHVTVFSVAGIRALAEREQGAPLPFEARTEKAVAG